MFIQQDLNGLAIEVPELVKLTGLEVLFLLTFTTFEPLKFIEQLLPLPLRRILPEVDRFNKVVRDIGILDQLAAAGNPVGVSNRPQVIEALRATRKELVRALKTERILRENQDFNPKQFAIDFSAHGSRYVGEQAGEYGKLLDEALQISVSVQEGMKQLQGSRSNPS